jgi:ABC-type phosphate/phosphonate transport system substrate-binding protein
MKKSKFFLIATAVTALMGCSLAQAAADAPRKYLTLAVSEGTSGLRDPAALIDKYAPFANALSGKGEREVRITPVVSFKELDAGMKSGEYDFVLARPADYPARGVRDYGYRALMKGKGSGSIIFIADKKSDMKTASDMVGRRIGIPEETSYAAKVVMAALAEQKILLKDTKFTYHKEQEVIGYAVGVGMMDAGAVMTYSKTGREWEKNGGKVIYRGRNLPFQPFIASNKVSGADAERVRARAIALGETPEGQAILKAAGMPLMEKLDDPRVLTDLLAYLDTGKTASAGAKPQETMTSILANNAVDDAGPRRAQAVIVPNKPNSVASAQPAARNPALTVAADKPANVR